VHFGNVLPQASATEFTGGVSVPRRIRRNGLWLVLPVLLGNAVFAGALPEVYSVDDGVPTWLLVLEWATRLAVFCAPLLMVVSLSGQVERLGAGLYAIGLIAYAGAWALVIAGGDAFVASHPVVAVAPYWLPAVFFAGLGLMARAYWYLPLVLSFSLVHTVHGLIALGLI
jgi:hypothetical protein